MAVNVLSNHRQLPLQYPKYQLNGEFAAKAALFLQNITLFHEIKTSSQLCEITHQRQLPSDDLLEKVNRLLEPLQESEWLKRRGITTFQNVYTLDYNEFSQDELLSLNLIPADHVIQKFGLRPVEGLIFPDFRNGQLFGIGVRNLSNDLEFAAAAKYTFSNFNHYLYGLDQVEDSVAICEGVFDQLALSSIGAPAVALGSAHPSFWQLACIEWKTRNVEIYMDNDFYGWCGAYAIARIFQRPHVWLPTKKDPAEEIFESEEPSFNQTKTTDLEEMIRSEIPIHNERIAELDVNNLHHFRNLKYNV